MAVTSRSIGRSGYTWGPGEGKRSSEHVCVRGAARYVTAVGGARAAGVAFSFLSPLVDRPDVRGGAGEVGSPGS
jgi:hypothetical protein